MNLRLYLESRDQLAQLTAGRCPDSVDGPLTDRPLAYPDEWYDDANLIPHDLPSAFHAFDDLFERVSAEERKQYLVITLQ